MFEGFNFKIWVRVERHLGVNGSDTHSESRTGLSMSEVIVRTEVQLPSDNC